MNWDVTEVKPVENHTIWVRFTDGTEGTVRFMPSFFRGVFKNLSEQSHFDQVKIVDGVVTWPGDLDLAPDAMHRQIKINGEWLLD